jgi:hypothetical protein
VVLDQGIDTSTAVGRMFFQILGSIAEFEHALMSERTMDGLAAARARGRAGGQKPKLGPRQVRLAQQMYDELGDEANAATPSPRSPPSSASPAPPSTATSPKHRRRSSPRPAGQHKPVSVQSGLNPPLTPFPSHNAAGPQPRQRR